MEFPSERGMLGGELANEASTSRFYAGLHYRFDGDAVVGPDRPCVRYGLGVLNGADSLRTQPNRENSNGAKSGDLAGQNGARSATAGNPNE